MDLNGGSYWVFSDRLASGKGIENREARDAEGATSGVIVGGWLIDGEGGERVSSGDVGLGGIFEGKEIRDGKVTTELVGRSGPEPVRGWKSSGL